ncbi:plasmid maintenance protein CcdB [Solimonas fluminis]|uniref:Toxin CcdB n=1 Tax=Solimonas fluminis TaxID=2086571 RepID=A0A2S5TJ79_9GAMM|nr:CcdB family protein [Solimonas fluminis]PPE75039.1 plasmid maintenance protein CcdB [Solimonas fluminis]
MAQFSVYRNPRASARHAPYLLDVQSDVVNAGLRVVVPLVDPGYFGPRAKRLNPLIEVSGADYVLSPAEIGSLPLAQLGAAVAHAGAVRQDILDALDFLLTGY